MRYVNIKSVNDIDIEGVGVELVFENKTMKAVKLIHKDKSYVFKNDSYNFVALVSEPPEKVVKHRVEANIYNKVVVFDFDSIVDAQIRLDELERQGYASVVKSVEVVKTYEEVDDPIPF